MDCYEPALSLSDVVEERDSSAELSHGESVWVLRYYRSLRFRVWDDYDFGVLSSTC